MFDVNRSFSIDYSEGFVYFIKKNRKHINTVFPKKMLFCCITYWEIPASFPARNKLVGSVLIIFNVHLGRVWIILGLTVCKPLTSTVHTSSDFCWLFSETLSYAYLLLHTIVQLSRQLAVARCVSMCDLILVWRRSKYGWYVCVYVLEREQLQKKAFHDKVSPTSTHIASLGCARMECSIWCIRLWTRSQNWYRVVARRPLLHKQTHSSYAQTLWFIIFSLVSLFHVSPLARSHTPVFCWVSGVNVQAGRRVYYTQLWFLRMISFYFGS